MRQFLLQMCGESGAGKSTLSRAIGRETGAVVIDKDVIKARMLTGDEDPLVEGLAEEIAGPMSYSVFLDLGASLLQQGLSVVLDSPASFTYIRERGESIATRAGAAYFIIRCCVDEVELLQARIDARPRMASQPLKAGLDNYARPGTSPLTEPYLRLDTSGPLESYLPLALEYIGHDVR